MNKAVGFVAMGFAVVVMFACFNSGFGQHIEVDQWTSNEGVSGAQTFSSYHRKLLQQNGAPRKCSPSDIQITQGQTAPLPSGIPTYTVVITNASPSSDISGIHLSCGSFSSARLINPSVFRRLANDDCLVNDGKPITSGSVISFQYANSFSYPLSVTSVSC